MRGYSNSYLVIYISLASAVAALVFTKSTHLGSAIQSSIPFGDLWISLIILIVACFAASSLVKISKQRTYFFSILAFWLLIIGVLIKLSLNHAFEIYYADYANSGPSRRLLYTSFTAWAVSLAGCTLLIFSLRPPTLLERITAKYKLHYLLIILAILAALTASDFNLLVESSPYTENTVNFGVVLMPIINVFFGALPPLDVQSQYGLYAYFMVPILKVIGLNVFNISLIFAILFFVCFIGIYYFTYSLTGSALVAFATMIASFYLNTSFGNIWPGELYFQFRPIRMLAPCLALFFFEIYSFKQSNLRRIFVLVCLSILVLWNLDSGVPTLAAFVVASMFNQYFAHNESATQRIKASMYLAFEGVFIPIIVLLVFSLTLFILKNEWVTPAMLLEPQLRWRAGTGFFSGWSQAIIWPTLIYCIGVALAITRGIAGLWGKQEFGLLLVALLGIGISTYGTLSPQAAALTTYLMPVILVQFALFFSRKITGFGATRVARSYGFFVLILCLLPVSFLVTTFIFHIRNNYSYTGIPTVWEILHPSNTNSKVLWEIPGKTSAEVDYVKVKDLTGLAPIVPPWVQKANWLKNLDYLTLPPNKGKVFIASMHDHFLYAAIQQASPIRIVNFYHIPIYNNWPLLYQKIKAKDFDYIVIDQTYFLRNGDAAGPVSFDNFIHLMDINYYKVAEKNIGYDWNYPLWKSSTISLYKVR